MGFVQKKINQILIRTLFEQFKKRAVRLLNRPDESWRVVRETTAKAEQVKGPLNRMWQDLMLLVGVIRDGLRGKYKGMSKGSLVVILGALLYFVCPIDAVPDYIPVAGYMDDAFVLGLVVSQLRAELERYRVWRERPAA